MSRIKVWALGSVGTAAILAGAALAQETTTYSYDGLGRLKASSITGGPNNTRTTGTCFDAAGNRTRYDVATGAPAAWPSSTPTPGPTPSPTPTPTPAPTPTPTNAPPNAVADSTSFNCSVLKTLNVTANDTDPENNLPLTVVSVSALSPSTWASVTSASSVQLGAQFPGTYSFTYVVSDSLGATSTGTITAIVNGNAETCQSPPAD